MARSELHCCYEVGIHKTPRHHNTGDRDGGFDRSHDSCLSGYLSPLTRLYDATNRDAKARVWKSKLRHYQSRVNIAQIVAQNHCTKATFAPRNAGFTAHNRLKLLRTPLPTWSGRSCARMLWRKRRQVNESQGVGGISKGLLT